MLLVTALSHLTMQQDEGAWYVLAAYVSGIMTPVGPLSPVRILSSALEAVALLAAS